MQQIARAVCFAALACFAVLSGTTVPRAHAAPLIGQSITTEAIFTDGVPADSSDQSVGPTTVAGSINSASNGSPFTWMMAGDSIVFTSNAVTLNLGTGDNFSPSAQLVLKFTLAGGAQWLPSASAIIRAIDVDASTSFSGNQLTMTVTGLDQVSGNGGQLELLTGVVPEPATLAVLGVGLGGLGLVLRRRRST